MHPFAKKIRSVVIAWLRKNPEENLKKLFAGFLLLLVISIILGVHSIFQFMHQDSLYAQTYVRCKEIFKNSTLCPVYQDKSTIYCTALEGVCVGVTIQTETDCKITALEEETYKQEVRLISLCKWGCVTKYCSAMDNDAGYFPNHIPTSAGSIIEIVMATVGVFISVGGIIVICLDARKFINETEAVLTFDFDKIHFSSPVTVSRPSTYYKDRDDCREVSLVMTPEQSANVEVNQNLKGQLAFHEDSYEFFNIILCLSFGGLEEKSEHTFTVDVAQNMVKVGVFKHIHIIRTIDDSPYELENKNYSFEGTNIANDNKTCCDVYTLKE